MADKVKNLVKDMRNVPSHVFGEHKLCGELAYFKCSKKEIEENLVPQMRECGLYEDIELCMNRLIFNASSLITDMDTNIAEHYNSIVCKFIGGKRINYSLKGVYATRCQAAAISFNAEGDYYGVLGKKISNRSPPTCTQRYVKQMKRKRQLSKKYASRRIFKTKKKPSLPDKDYGPEAIPEPDLPDDIFQEKKEIFLKSLEKSKEELATIEVQTRGQSGNPLWNQERMTRLTASHFGEICKMRKTTSCINKIKQLLYSPFLGNDNTKYGIEHEPFAIKQFEEEFGLKVEPCGLFIDEENFIFGASPDGVVGREFLVEVKCPRSILKLHPFEAIKEKKIRFATLDENNQLLLKENHNYHYQIQGQLHITKRIACYFIVWSPVGMLVQKVRK